MSVKLYDYWRSSAACRLRIALNLKGISFESVPISLHPDHLEQKSPEYKALNPQMRVPAIEVEGEVIGQSMAILDWLDETWSDPPILPSDPLMRLKARAFADTIACDVHPLNNTSVQAWLRDEMGQDKAAIATWYAEWIHRGFAALEDRIDNTAGAFLFADYPTVAEIALIPQVYNARRFDVDLSAYPKLVAIDAACMALEAFQKASPEANAPA